MLFVAGLQGVGRLALRLLVRKLFRFPIDGRLRRLDLRGAGPLVVLKGANPAARFGNLDALAVVGLHVGGRLVPSRVEQIIFGVEDGPRLFGDWWRAVSGSPIISSLVAVAVFDIVLTPGFNLFDGSDLIAFDGWGDPLS